MMDRQAFLTAVNASSANQTAAASLPSRSAAPSKGSGGAGKPQHSPLSNSTLLQDDDEERIMALEFQGLSVQEREHAYYDLHGVSEAQEETDDLIQDSLELYHGFLASMTQDTSDPRSQSYSLALKQDAAFVQGKWLALLFLRAHLFDAKKAAEALLCHLYLQHTMIGEHAIARVLRQSDMSPQDLDFLKSGILQLLPRRDSSGRAVIVIAMNHLTKEHLDNYRHIMNSIAYLIWKAAMDEETQKRGLVFVQYNIGPSFRPFLFNPSLLAHTAQVIPGLPLKLVAVHTCYSSKFYAPLATLSKLLSSRNVRFRTRYHEYDSHLECQYALMTFGLPVQTAWPVDAMGNLCQVERHAGWLTAQAKWEAVIDNDDDEIVLLPSRFDVLAGRAHIGHAGNLRLKYLLEERAAEYEACATKKTKTVFIGQLVEAIGELGGRFLEEYYGAWKIQSTVQANRRVSSLIRSSWRRKNTSTTSNDNAKVT